MDKKGEIGRPEVYEGGFKCVHRSIPAKMVPELNKWIAENKPRFKKGYKPQETANYPVDSVTPTVDHQSGATIPKIDFTGERYLDIEKFSKYPSSKRPESVIDRPAWNKKKKEYDDNVRQQWNAWKLKIQLSQ